MRTYLLRAVARFARQLALTSPLPFPVLPGAALPSGILGGALPGSLPGALPGVPSGVLAGALPPVDAQRR
ncbi:hypothetical protein ABTX81_09950 [Kitasatospora sp. NPDC097605]|uniref:hypothetical protein n=1 Tax=Kitasatospora sp. NPDC097605 TaxID=3157226 RepID=UPI00332B6E68